MSSVYKVGVDDFPVDIIHSLGEECNNFSLVLRMSIAVLIEGFDGLCGCDISGWLMRTSLYRRLRFSICINGRLRVRSPKNGTFLERKIFVWHATIVIRSIIAIGLEK